MRALLIVIALALSTPAWAQKTASKAERARAEQFFRAGEQAYNTGQYQLAAEAFEEAYAILPLPAIAFSTAQAYRLHYFVDKQPSDLERAVELYRVYLEGVEQGGRRNDAAASLAELEPILIRLRAQGAMGDGGEAAQPVTKLMVTSAVPGAQAIIGEGEAAAVPVVRELPPGRYRVRVSADGYAPFDELRDVVEGQFRVVEVELQPLPAQVSIEAEAGASIAVDGRVLGTTPLLRPLEVAEGTHVVTVSLRGRRPWSREIRVKKAEKVELEADLEVTSQRRASVWTLGAGAAVLFAGGVYGGMALAADGDASELDERRRTQGLVASERLALADAISRRDDRRRTAAVLVGTGAILAAAGAVLYWFDSAPEAPGLDFRPSLCCDSVGLALGGRF